MAEKKKDVSYDSEREMYRYPWLEEMTAYFRTRLSNFFVLHENIHDMFLWNKTDVVTLEDYLYKVFVNKKTGYDLFLTYAMSSGFRTKRASEQKLLTERLRHLASRESEKESPGKDRTDRILQDYLKRVDQPVRPIQALPVIERLLRGEADDAEQKDGAVNGQKDGPRERKMVVLIHSLEKLIPNPDRGGGQQNPEVLEMLQRIALDTEIRLTPNILIALTTDLSQVDPALFSVGNRCREIEIPLPGNQEKTLFLSQLAELDKDNLASLSPFSDDFSTTSQEGGGIRTLSEITTGFSLRHLDTLNRLSKYRSYMDNQSFDNACMGFEDVRDMKREVIQEESRNLLQEVEATRGFEAIGGLEKIRSYLEGMAKTLREGTVAQKRSLPKGILLAGPPGTGKTILAEALAKAGQLNMVKMGDIRGEYVGQSERNLSRALHLIVELAPVLVFVDEIDQAIGGRSIGPSGDSGVNQRIFGKLLEYMGSDRYRGRIIWVAATNRPDVLDEAMVRRFDRIIPVLMPNQDARKRILEVMPKNLGGFRYEDRIDLDGAAENTEGLTGSDIQVILTRAVESADDYDEAGLAIITDDVLKRCIETFIHNHNEEMFELQSLISIRFCNFSDNLPDPRELPQNISEIVQARIKKDNNPIEMRIRELQQILGSRRIA